MTRLDPKIQHLAESLAAAHPDSMVGVFESSTGTYLYVSPSHLNIMGFPPSELVGKTLSQRVHPDDLQHTLLAFQDASLNGKSIEIGVRLIDRAGRPFRVRASALHVVGSGGEDLMLGRATPVDE